MTALPVVVVHVLAYECVRLHSAICIHLRHIHVVYEVDQSSAAWRSIVAPCFLLKGLFQHRCGRDEWTSREQKCRKERMNTEKDVIEYQYLWSSLELERDEGQHGDI